LFIDLLTQKSKVMDFCILVRICARCLSLQICTCKWSKDWNASFFQQIYRFWLR